MVTFSDRVDKRIKRVKLDKKRLEDFKRQDLPEKDQDTTKQRQWLKTWRLKKEHLCRCTTLDGFPCSFRKKSDTINFCEIHEKTTECFKKKKRHCDPTERSSKEPKSKSPKKRR